MTLTPEKLAELRELAKAAESFTRGRLWSYDDGITDYHDGVPERGKHQVVECGASIIVCDPAMQDDDMNRVDAFGRHIAAADPQTVLALVDEVERLRARVAELEPSTSKGVQVMKQVCKPHGWRGGVEFVAKVDRAINAMCDPMSPNFARTPVEVRAGMDAVRDRLVEAVAGFERATLERDELRAENAALLEELMALLSRIWHGHLVTATEARMRLKALAAANSGQEPADV